MKRTSLFVTALLSLSSLTVYAAPSDLAQMVQTEYDFADMAKREGYKASFLKYLSDDSVMFENGPVPARKHVSNRPEMKGTLQWYPAYAVVASTGDMGLSTGPWIYANPAGQPSAHGHFVSIWRKQPDGTWLNALDVGVNHEEMKPAPEKLKISAPTGHADSTSAAHADRSADIRAAEAQFAQLATASGYAAAAEQLARTDLHVYRDGRPPVTGTAEATALLKEKDATGTPRVDYAAGSGDFGYAYGTIAKNQFLHVWKQQNGKWQLLADLLLP
jgi:ketosteroid isomerase-like protein